MKITDKKRHLSLKLLISVLVLLILALSLVSCNMDSEFVSGRIKDYDVPSFDYSKLKGVEMVYRDYYVEELPEAGELTKKTAEIYFAKYHDNINTKDKDKVTEALIDSYIEVIGDAYSVYRTAEEHESYDAGMSGSYHGIGITVNYDKSTKIMKIVNVASDGGAQLAGMLCGDIITKVDGELVSELDYDTVISKVRGELNTRVEITVLRGDEELTFSVLRKKIVEQTVTYSIDENKIGYIEITSFKGNTDEQFADAVEYMKENGAVGIIYDLRSNPGGYLDSVVNMLSYIAPRGKIVTFTSKNNGYPAMYDNNLHSLSLPSVVICNGDTASAGELFTSAMRDFATEEFGYFDVTIVGTKTFGKGIMQSTKEFTDGSAVTLTVAYYNPPSGVNYHGEGITPDVTVEMGESGDGQLDAAYAEMAKLIEQN